MAEALYRSIENVGQLTPEIRYQDNWTILPFRQNDAMNIAYNELKTAKPLSVACEQEMTADCVAKVSYEEHIKPLWSLAGRDEDGNACVDCHDNRGFTKLDLTDFDMSGDKGSYEALFGDNRTFMFLSAEYSQVEAQHCRRYVQPPFLMEPENDCFTCFGQSVLSAKGAIPSANFFDLFDDDQDDNHWYFNPGMSESYQSEIRYMHQGMLTLQERKLIAEWLDSGAAR